MQTTEQRQLGANLAGNLEAKKTKDSIVDPTCGYKEIFRTAVTEVAVDDIVTNVIEGPPEWSYHALRHIPNLSDEHRQALITRSTDDPLAALHTLRFVPDLGAQVGDVLAAAGTLAQNQGEISGFYLNNKGSFNCEFTMYWTNEGKVQPAAGSPSDQWKWSSKLMVGQDTKKLCSDFAIAKSPTGGGSPLQPGNEVWMYLWVQAGSDIQSPLRFTYNPNTAGYAYFTSSGSTQNDALGLDKIAPPT